MSMINCNDTIRNRTRNLSACSAVPQQTAPPGASPRKYNEVLTSENITAIFSNIKKE